MCWLDVYSMHNLQGPCVIPSVCLPGEIPPVFCGLRWMWWIGGGYDHPIFEGVDHGRMDISWFLGSVEEVGVGENNSLIDTCTKLPIWGF